MLWSAGGFVFKGYIYLYKMIWFLDKLIQWNNIYIFRHHTCTFIQTHGSQSSTRRKHLNMTICSNPAAKHLYSLLAAIWRGSCQKNNLLWKGNIFGCGSLSSLEMRPRRKHLNMTICSNPAAKHLYSLFRNIPFSFEPAAQEGICRNKPVLAVCIYHNAVDMFSIMLFLHQLVPLYTSFLMSLTLSYILQLM